MRTEGAFDGTLPALICGRSGTGGQAVRRGLATKQHCCTQLAGAFAVADAGSVGLAEHAVHFGSIARTQHASHTTAALALAERSADRHAKLVGTVWVHIAAVVPRSSNCQCCRCACHEYGPLFDSMHGQTWQQPVR